MISHDQRLIFVHIQKTGGNAICAALGQPPDCPEKHFLARDLRERYGAKTWDDYFKFGFVRNPWDRLVSWWSMMERNRAAGVPEARLNAFQRFILDRANTFEQFLENCDEEILDQDGPKWIYRNQLDYLVDSSGQLAVDFVGRFENLQQDFDFIARRAGGLPRALPRMNASQHRHYGSYYTPALAQKVADRFERDIQAFGYTFGD